jgi:hypothetical protein
MWYTVVRMLQKLRVALLAPKYIELRGTEDSLLLLQESATGVHSDPNESCPHSIYLESIVKVYKYASRRISSHLLHPGEQIKILNAFLLSSTQAKCMPPHFILLSLNNVIIFDERSNYEAPYFKPPPPISSLSNPNILLNTQQPFLNTPPSLSQLTAL